ncbi:MAG: hypothetical protein IKT55_06755 [Clostridia bacterium]|nr:hypothetical protein [Clostridia bacterium]
MLSSVEFKNDRPYISIDGTSHYPLAYTTYFEECGEFSDFIKAGYKMFFINVSFTTLPINNVSRFSPFLTGIFEGDEPDYGEFDGVVHGILAECPDALIFPRINVAMPRKWIAKNTDECVQTPSGLREALWSEKYFNDGAELLATLLSHIRSADYSHRISGYQICGGTTQEWMHPDMAGSFSEKGLEKFRHWMKERYNADYVPPITKEDLFKVGYNETVSCYGEFCCEVAANAVEHFCKVTKSLINNEQVVGAFYGYNAFVNDPLLGLAGLRHIIDSPYIDFFSSPCCYDCTRELGVDWGDMITERSLRLHNKLYFVECDIRTHLTKMMQESRPGTFEGNYFNLKNAEGKRTVWGGPDTLEESLSAVHKAFAHQLTHFSGIWWFDMWGGWYHHDSIMLEMIKMKNIAEGSKDKEGEYPRAETVVFIDERAYYNNPRCTDVACSVNNIRVAMGNTGIPFDLCMTEDAERVIDKYKVAIFTTPLPSERGKMAMELCDKYNIPHLFPEGDKIHISTPELREYLVSNGVHCYNDGNNVVYCGGGYVGIHTKNAGQVEIKLPRKYRVKPLLGIKLDEQETDVISLYMNKHETALFELI